MDAQDSALLEALLNANPGAKRALAAKDAVRDADMKKALATKDADKEDAVAKARYDVFMEERAMMKQGATTCARSAWHFPIS